MNRVNVSTNSNKVKVSVNYFSVKVSTKDESIDIKTKEDKVELKNNSTIVSMGASHYRGDYDVDPRFIEQTLETKDKLMGKDVTVRPIDVFTTTNLSGGNTVIIGK